MKALKDILYRSRIIEVNGSTDTLVSSIVFDSRNAVEGSVFVAVHGYLADGHKFISTAIDNGAVVVVCEEIPVDAVRGVTWVKVVDSRKALAIMATNYYDHPSEQLQLVAITGTNGKTTCATMLYRLFTSLGHKTGLISTVENRVVDQAVGATHTTPDPVELNALLSQMVEAGCTYAFMEVSSHALHQHRVGGIGFAGAVFTNITHDHLDYHGDFKSYIAAKKILFDGLPKDAFALVNGDDKNSGVMLQNTKADRRMTFALNSMADFKAKLMESDLNGLHLLVDGLDIYTKLVGKFNAYNILAVYGTAVLLGAEKMDVLTKLSLLDPVAGRFEYLKSSDGVVAIIDYAHTPDALENVLKTIGGIRTRNEEVITVVGCGGNRDKAKRPEMARIACQFSDRVILTSDNPRDENPEAIIDDMKRGVEPHQFKKTHTITNREEAIRMACTLAKPGDIILIAGKGHEKYQEVKGQKLPFDDVAVVKESFKSLKH